MTGYLHPDYAESLAEFGTPRNLPRCGGWILERDIPGSQRKDAMGCYPVFACEDWSQLNADLDSLQDQLISIALVADPFGENDAEYLRLCFPDVCMPFKSHHVVDLSQSREDFVHAHHKRNARRASQDILVELCSRPEEGIAEWIALYSTLIVRHSINGIAAFSPKSFEKQMRVPGVVAFRSLHGDNTVGMTLWYMQGNVGYYHLGAYSDAGYRLHASYAMFWYAIQYFAETGLLWLDLGGGAGVRNDGSDGLTRFKQGWSTGTRAAYFCGRILDNDEYQRIVEAKGNPSTTYFPAYRSGEFTSARKRVNGLQS